MPPRNKLLAALDMAGVSRMWNNSVCVFGAALGLFVAVLVPATAATLHPWCASGTGRESGALTCAYSTYEQCILNTRSCQANPDIHPLPRVPTPTPTRPAGWH